MTAEKELVVVARFRDLATKEVKRMGTGFTKFGRSAIKAIKKVNASMLKLTVGLNQGLSLIGKMGRAFAAMARLVAIPVRLAIEQERVEAQLTQVIKSTGGAAGLAAVKLREMAAAMQQLTTFGDETIIGAQNLLLTFTNIGGSGGIFERSTQAVLDVATAMGMDLKGAALQVGKALNDPATGLSMLTRVGITFSETQKDLIKDLQKMGDTAGAQTVILDELERQFGGSAAAAKDTFGGALVSLNNDFGDLLENVGTFITQNEDLKVLIGAIAGEISKWTGEMKDLTASQAGQRAFAEGMRAAIVAMLEAIQGINTAFALMAQAIVTVARKLADMAGVTLPVNQTQRDLIENMKEIREQIRGIESGQNAVKGGSVADRFHQNRVAADLLRERLESLQRQYETAGGATLDFVTASENVNRKLDALAESLREVDFDAEKTIRTFDSLTEVFDEATDAAKGFVDTLLDARFVDAEATTQNQRAAWQGVTWMVEDATEWVDKYLERIKDVDPATTEKEAEAFAHLVINLKAAVDWMKQLAEPSQTVGEKMVAGFGDGIRQALAELRDFRTEAERATTDLLQGTQRGLVDFFKAIRDGTEGIGGAITTLLQTVGQKMSDLLLEFAANRALQGILEGFSSLTGIGAGADPEAENKEALSANTLALLSLKASLDGGGALGLIGGGGVDPGIENLNADLVGGQEESAGLLAGIGSAVSGLGGIFVGVGNFLFQGLLSIVSAIGTLIATGSFKDAFGSFVGFSGGGPVNYLAGGGMPAFDPRGTDTVPAMLTPGEFVMKRSAVQAIGIGRLKRANKAQGFADGGLVGGGGGGDAAPAVNIGITINAVDARGVRDMLQGRDGQEAIIGVVRRGIAKMPQFQNQIGRLGKK